MTTQTGMGGDGLPSWREGPAKFAIVERIRRASIGRDAVPPAERIAVFAHDGVLACARPAPLEASFALARIVRLLAEDPSLRKKEPFRAVLDRDDISEAKTLGRDAIELLGSTFGDLTPGELHRQVRSWFPKAKGAMPERARARTVYKPMVELLNLLRAYGFTTFVAAAPGAVEVVRALSDELYGVPARQVVSRNELEVCGSPRIAFGSTDDDVPLLRAVTADLVTTSLACAVRHDDAARDVAYDLDARLARGKEDESWHVVSVRDDFARVFA